MQLKTVKYSQYENTPRLWKLENCTLDEINLVVGKNATGKSMTLNIIRGLAIILSRQRQLPFISGNYHVVFEKKGKQIIYDLKYEDQKVIKEKLLIDDHLKLERRSGGKGKIFTSKLDDYLEFRIPHNEVAALAKRDTMQHPFLEDLHSWGKNVMHFRFGTPLGKETYPVLIDTTTTDTTKAESNENIDLLDTEKATEIFWKGEHEFKEEFVNEIKNNMKTIRYNIDKIEVGPPQSIVFKANFPSKPVCLLVKESDLRSNTDQSNMSQGMFRALSTIIQINYALLKRIPSCILIDDIGEGLDYTRSISLIKLLIDKIKQTHVQLIMSTNDRFVMNNVPLQYWSIIDRKGNKSKMINYHNKPKVFEQFELTGLNNFDFFSSNYFLKTN
ncbi:MAG: ATP-binding protein [Deltaproteobacteria bacterium]|nr:ATP-binding protein [Deltaproteobacteria bacterium]